jgi:L-asparaginase II
MIVAEVVRSGFVESVHHGSVAVLGGPSRGDVTSAVFPRSSNKPLQTVGMLRTGLAPRDAADLALISGSHYGEPLHVRRVRDILEAAGLEPGALRCPAALPYSETARDTWVRSGGGREPILMNCSGKHAGMLATCVANGWPLESYLDPKHPLPALAGAFLRLVDAAPGTDERRVADAMRAHPKLVAGTAVDDTVLMESVPGLLVKGGAEGVVAAAVPGVGAVAIKIEDGAQRARTPVLIDELRGLGVDVPVIEHPVLGGGEPVGVVRAVR